MDLHDNILTGFLIFLSSVAIYVFDQPLGIVIIALFFSYVAAYRSIQTSRLNLLGYSFVGMIITIYAFSAVKYILTKYGYSDFPSEPVVLILAFVIMDHQTRSWLLGLLKSLFERFLGGFIK